MLKPVAERGSSDMLRILKGMCLFASFKEHFHNLSEWDLLHVALLMRHRRLSEGEVLCLIGEPSNDCYYLLRGEIGVITNVNTNYGDPEDVKANILTVMGVGACVGESGVMFNSNRYVIMNKEQPL